MGTRPHAYKYQITTANVHHLPHTLTWISISLRGLMASWWSKQKKHKLAVGDNTIPFVHPHAASSVFPTISPSSCGFAAQVCALIWPLGAPRSLSGLCSPLIPCSGAPESHHRLCPRTTPPFPRPWALHRRSGTQGAGWTCEHRRQ